MSKDFLVVSEEFYSIQGEGPSVGKPAVFMRLSGCNLRCQGFSFKDPHTGEHLGCDTTHVWRRGRKKTFFEIFADWHQQGWLEKLEKGAHLVITGGEPMLQQPGIIAFLQCLDHELNRVVYVEMETNATLFYSEALLHRIQQFNVSPKLKNSGELKSKTIKPDILSGLAKRQNVIFKFVIVNDADIFEVLEDFTVPYNIAHSRVWLMPEGGTLSAISAKLPKVMQLAKQYQMNVSPRLHILTWDKATGV